MKATATRMMATGIVSRVASRHRADSEVGFTLVEMTTSVAVLLVVLTAAWLLLTASNTNLSTIENGGQASELNRAAFAAFERDLGHAVLPPGNSSPVLYNGTRRCALLVDDDKDRYAELVVWSVDESQHRLERSVTNAVHESNLLGSEADFAGGVTTTATVLAGIATAADTPSPALFTYAVSATTDATHTADIGLITIHLRNGLPSPTANVIDRTASFRVIALVINGY
ncbi:MAG TPA: hypothetical protein VIK31_08050 [Propionibacteriaceae bacterium]